MQESLEIKNVNLTVFQPAKKYRYKPYVRKAFYAAQIIQGAPIFDTRKGAWRGVLAALKFNSKKHAIRMGVRMSKAEVK